MKSTLYVPHAEWWWFATRDDLPWLTDPDEDDGRVRHADRDERGWAAIATAVGTVAQSIACDEHDVDDEYPNMALVPVDLTGLGMEDKRIVKSWFRAGSEAPSTDPWKDTLTNGRHRLWATWQAEPNALLPVYSDLLVYLDDVPLMDDEFARVLRQSAFDGLRQMPSGPASRSPRYVSELRRVASEGGHDLDELPRSTTEPP